MMSEAVIRLGPIRFRYSPVAPLVALLAFVVSIAIYVITFIWFANTSIPHNHPTDYTNFWYGMLHGWFAIPSLILSLFNDSITIYQSPNNGAWYNLGYLIGIGLLLSSFKD